MALGPLLRIPAALPAPSPARNVTGAQQAFFQAALGKAAPMAAIETPEPRPAPAPEPPKAAAAAPADEPKSAYRPGLLLDITI